MVKQVLSQAIPDSNCFLMGSFPLRTYLPDSDVDVAVLVSDVQKAYFDTHAAFRKILDALYCATIQPGNQDASHTLRNISFVNAKTPILQCTVGNIDLDITVNQIGSLGAITFLEEADRFIGKQHLLKRSLLLVKVYTTLTSASAQSAFVLIRACSCFLSFFFVILCNEALVVGRGNHVCGTGFVGCKARHVFVIRR